MLAKRFNFLLRRRGRTRAAVTRCGLLAAFLVTALLPAPADALTFNLSQVAVVGDTAPGTGGNTYSSFAGHTALNDTGDVAFGASGTGFQGVFLDSGGTDTDVALFGETAPGTGGGTYDFLPFSSPLSVNSSGKVMFHSLVGGSTPPTISEGLFTAAGGTDAPVALVSIDIAPGTGGGTYSNFGAGNRVSMNNSGDVAFSAGISGGTVTEGLFVESGGTDTAVLLAGDVAPGTGGGTYSFLGLARPSLNNAGDLAFLAFIAGGSTSEGIFLSSGGSESLLVNNGGVAPGTGGGTFLNLIGPSLNSSGDVAFWSNVSGGTATEGIFLHSGGTDVQIALQGDAAPGTGGGAFSLFDNFTVSMNDAGDVVFKASITGGTVSDGVFLYDAQTGQIFAVALAGDAAPGLGGATFTSFVAGPSGGIELNNLGQVAFQAGLSSGSSGVFLAAQAPVPEPATLLLLGGGLAGLRLARSRRKTPYWLTRDEGGFK